MGSSPVEEGTATGNGHLPEWDSTEAASSSSPAAIQETNTGSSSLYLLLGDQRFMLVGAMLELLKGLATYKKLIVQVPSLAQEPVRRMADLIKVCSLRLVVVVFFFALVLAMRPMRQLILLQFFNSKSCQLVLGAGALSVAGLKSITPKHLGEHLSDPSDLHILLSLPCLASL